MSRTPMLAMNVDCLIMIFDTITQDIPYAHDNKSNNTRPLNILRAASQVCHQWRSSLLASPWIWGRVIDIDIVEYGIQRGQWMEEVVRRAGSAPWWISGHIDRAPHSSIFDGLSFFIRLLDSWERIEAISVKIYQWIIPEDIQVRFLSRAPLLKHFEVDIPAGKKLFFDDLQPDSSQGLFGDHAPLLRTMNTNNIVFKIDSRWLAGIREMVPIPLKFRSSMGDVFALLQRTPKIRKFYLDRSLLSSRDDTSLASLPRLKLPYLISLALAATLTDAAKLLDNISPAVRLSSLRIRILGRGSLLLMGDPASALIPSFKKNLRSYISNYFTANAPTYLCVCVMNINLNISMMGNGGPTNPEFEVEIMTEALLFDMDHTEMNLAMASVLDTFDEASSETAGLFDSVSGIMLNLAYAPTTVFKNIRWMLTVFRRLQSICIDEDSGVALCAICFPAQSTGAETPDSHSPVLLPELHTVQLTERSDIIRKDGTALIDFLLKRKSIGYPIARFDLTMCEVPHYMPKDLRALDDLRGLEVVVSKKDTHRSELGKGDVYDIWTYVCGSGGLD